VASLAAAACNIGMAADVQNLELDANGKLQADRPVYSGNILTTVVFREGADGDRAQPKLPHA
jgi:electron transfer flavoprotein alpha subunit